MTQEIITQITDTVGTEVFGIWFLIGAAEQRMPVTLS